MTWHYAINGQTRGPVGDEEFQRLVQQGIINGETLIWRDGMANWAPYGNGGANIPPPSAAAIQDGVACAMCRRIISETMRSS